MLLGARKAILYLYILLIAIFGIIFVPSYLMYGYGANRSILSLECVPLWKLVDKSIIINDSVARYEINIPRALYTFAIITVIIIVLYLVTVVSDINKKTTSGIS